MFYASGMPADEVWNLGLTPAHADGRVRSGMSQIHVIHLARGTTLYRFQSAGQSLGRWWTTREVLEHLLQLSQLTGLDLGTHARIGAAVLHGWSDLNEVIVGEVSRPCMAFLGQGRPQSELIPRTNVKITYESCRHLPQVYVPVEDLVGRSGRRQECMAVKSRERIKSRPFLAEHHPTPVAEQEARRQQALEHQQASAKLDAALQRLKAQQQQQQKRT